MRFNVFSPLFLPRRRTANSRLSTPPTHKGLTINCQGEGFIFYPPLSIALLPPPLSLSVSLSLSLHKHTPLASTASFLQPPLGPTEYPCRRRGVIGGRTPRETHRKATFLTFTQSPSSVPKWVPLDSLHSHPFPSGSEPPDQESTFPAVFAQLGTLPSPVSRDAEAEKSELFETNLKFHWPTGASSTILDEEVLRKVFREDPLWFSYSFPTRSPPKETAEGREQRDVEKWRKYTELRRRQFKVETEAWERAAEEYRELQREMVKKRLAPELPYVKLLFLGWFEPLRDAIVRDQKVQESRHKYVNWVHAEHIGLLPADKVAVIVMHKLVGMLMLARQERCVKVVQAALQIGKALEQEVRIENFLWKTKKRGNQGEKNEDALLRKEQAILRSRVRKLLKRKKLKEVQKIIKSDDEAEAWGRVAQAKLGSRLIELIIESAVVQYPQSAGSPPDLRPAFKRVIKTATKGDRKWARYGVIECDPLVCEGFESNAKNMVIPYMPMLIPPKKWKGYGKGGHLCLPSYVMRTHGAKQRDAIKNAPAKQLRKVFEALDTLGGTKWRINKRILGVVEAIWSNGGSLAGMVDRTDVPIPKKPDSEDASDLKKWRWDCIKAKKKNNEMHSLRCDMELKLSVARRMTDEEGFYYPHNLDFRGRAYPLHPHLNHLGSDVCRGILEFAEGRPLGKSGLRWLRIQLANLYAGGIEKQSVDDRLAFVENNLHYIFDSADRPIDGALWWLHAEDPFQCLAACVNLSEALRSSSPHNVISHLPIHQDGSCNGLQHYAALGRDRLEAGSVNLVAGDKPADVYSGIAARVLDHIRRDSEKDLSTYPDALLAKLLVNQVDRKLVKQTVMTSVYGVTYVGAREQIKKRLEERGLITDDKLLFGASCYAAKVTMIALGEMFHAARGIMQWLAGCAKVIVSEDQPVRWTTPLGLPVVQAYMKSEIYSVKTSLQILSLKCETDSVAVRRQKTAFPPNFIHSLDGSHMMMTAIACKEAHLNFAGVHDSFWTHACDVDQMNRILREQFVQLHSTPILENLLEEFEKTYPTLDFPSRPDRGDFDLKEVLRSPYFFN